MKIEISKIKTILLPPVYDEGNQTNKDLRLKGPLQSSFNIQTNDTLDCKIAKMFYSSLAFHLARSSHYRSAFSYAANTCNLNAYVLSTYKKLRGLLVSKKRSRVENLLQPIRNS